MDKKKDLQIFSFLNTFTGTFFYQWSTFQIETLINQITDFFIHAPLNHFSCKKNCGIIDRYNIKTIKHIFVKLN